MTWTQVLEPPYAAYPMCQQETEEAEEPGLKSALRVWDISAPTEGLLHCTKRPSSGAMNHACSSTVPVLAKSRGYCNSSTLLLFVFFFCLVSCSMYIKLHVSLGGDGRRERRENLLLPGIWSGLQFSCGTCGALQTTRRLLPYKIKVLLSPDLKYQLHFCSLRLNHVFETQRAMFRAREVKENISHFLSLRAESPKLFSNGYLGPDRVYVVGSVLCAAQFCQHPWPWHTRC